MNIPIHRLFIIGAGFSKPAGLPLGEDLFKCVREDVRRFFRDYEWEGPLEREISEWKSLYPDQPIDLERVLAYSHRKHYLRLLGSDEYFEHGSQSVTAVRTAIQRILIQETPSETPTLYRDFAERLCAYDVVLTFNYDTLLEQTFEDVGKLYTLTPEWWLKSKPSGYKPKYVDLLKLHGSIDWYDRRYHDEAMRGHTEKGHDVPNQDPIFGQNPSVPSESLSRGPTEVYGSHLLPRVFRVPNHTGYFPIEGGLRAQVVPYILPPAHDKLLGYDAILDLWENLHRTQDVFSSIVIIGYSFPPYDSYAYEALGRLLDKYQHGGDTTNWEQRRVPIQLVTLEDSEQHVLKDIPFLDPAKTRVWNQGFSNAALNWIDWGDASA